MFSSERFIGEVLDGKYRLERLLGQGGMGAVYLATHLGTERPVALKLITPEFMRNDEFVERFRREARAAGRLRHPNVVDVTDFGFAEVDAQRVAYLVMEYLDGCTLGDVLAEESRLPLDWVIDILEQTCSAVDEAHQQGVVHRDLKPDNIWLEPNRFGGYRVKVLDFGIAKLAAVSTGELGPLAETNESPASATQTTLPAAHAGTQSHAAQASGASVPSSLERTGSGGSRHTASSDSASEAATRLHLPNPSSAEEQTRLAEQQTRLFAPPSTPHAPDAPNAAEAATRIINARPDDGDKTLRLEHTTAGRKIDILQTSPASGVTRVGAILGTPTYMSPEQCRSEQLDARSDIYSLGVIAYQMLTGETPFTGDIVAVMRQHMEAQPPPIREKNKKVKKKMAQLVMSVLAKNPAERPASAAAFAAALRGTSEGIGSLLRRAFALYSEHFPKFLRISLIAHVPVILVTFLLISVDVMRKSEVLSSPLAVALLVILGLLAFCANFLAAAMVSAMTTLIVTQLHVVPMRPISLRAVFVAFRKRWRPFLRTSIRVTLMIILGFMLLVIPGFIFMIRYYLYAPVVLMEGLEKRAALKRANELSRRSRRTVIALVAIHLLLPSLLGGLVGFFAGSAFRVRTDIGPKITVRIGELFNIFTIPLFSITTALLYLKMRQIGGETFKETMEQFEDVEAPRSNWQQRMRRRLTMNTPTSRG